MPNVRRVVLLILALAGFVLSVRPAEAVSVSITSDESTDVCDTSSSFGTVTLTQSGTSVDVEVVLFNSFQFAKTGAGDFQIFKFNVSGAPGPITVDQTVPGQTLAAQSGTFHRGGTGDFGFGITCTTCRNGRAGSLPVGTTIVFHVANATISQLTQSNDLGNIFVADVLCVPTGKSGTVSFAVP